MFFFFFVKQIIGVYSGPYQHDVCTYFLTGLSWILIIMFFPISLILIFRVVQEYERGIIIVI